MPLNTLANMESLNLNSMGKTWERNWENNNPTNICSKRSTPGSAGELKSRFHFQLQKKERLLKFMSSTIFWFQALNLLPWAIPALEPCGQKALFLLVSPFVGSVLFIFTVLLCCLKQTAQQQIVKQRICSRSTKCFWTSSSSRTII